MSLLPTTVVRGAPPALQPHYFTSSLFVEPLREDISDLLNGFKDVLQSQPRADTPFQLFKKQWMESGWRWVHLLAMEERGRKAFLEVVERCLLEVVSVDEPIRSAGAIFALYTFHTTQPSSLFTTSSIDLPLDIHSALRSLPALLSGKLQIQTAFILRRLSPSFRLTPASTLLPPLPYAVVTRAPRPQVLNQGRLTVKSRRENYVIGLRRLTREVDELNAIARSSSRDGADRTDGHRAERKDGVSLPSADEYVRTKEELVAALAEDDEGMRALREGTLKTERRMKEIEAWALREGKAVEGYDWEGKPIGLELVGGASESDEDAGEDAEGTDEE